MGKWSPLRPWRVWPGGGPLLVSSVDLSDLRNGMQLLRYLVTKASCWLLISRSTRRRVFGAARAPSSNVVLSRKIRFSPPSPIFGMDSDQQRNPGVPSSSSIGTWSSATAHAHSMPSTNFAASGLARARLPASSKPAKIGNSSSATQRAGPKSRTARRPRDRRQRNTKVWQGAKRRQTGLADHIRQRTDQRHPHRKPPLRRCRVDDSLQTPLQQINRFQAAIGNPAYQDRNPASTASPAPRTNILDEGAGPRDRQSRDVHHSHGHGETSPRQGAWSPACNISMLPHLQAGHHSHVTGPRQPGKLPHSCNCQIRTKTLKSVEIQSAISNRASTNSGHHKISLTSPPPSSSARLVRADR